MLTLVFTFYSAGGATCGDALGGGSKFSYKQFQKALQPLADAQKQQTEKLQQIQNQMCVLSRNVGLIHEGNNSAFCHRDLFLVGMVLAVQLIMLWMFR